MAVLTDPGDGHFSSLQGGEAYASTLSVAFLEAGSLPSGTYPRLKRALDFLISLALLLALAPALLLIAVAVVLDSRGPILFRQTRVGQYGRPFAMLKFRTMRGERRRRNAGPPDGSPDRRRRHKSFGDPRVTRVGRLLRRTCLDELPQLINVVMGDMSLVGPRPELPIIVSTYQTWQHQRHVVAPGITGWWQVNRDSDRLMHESTELDIYYVLHYSLVLDLRILACTLGAIIDGTGAY
jgi:lipopolysaccharide/colanic/teichoic acid biosynthesis glycosyltransferase